MKAIVLESFGGPEKMSYQDVNKPRITDDQLLIKVHATSVNRPDIVQRQGNYPAPKGESDILGLEVAGVVDQIGISVSGWKKGDRVMALVGGGGYAEYTAAYPAHAMAMPDALRDEHAACICETYITAYLNIFLLGSWLVANLCCCMVEGEASIQLQSNFVVSSSRRQRFLLLHPLANLAA